MPVLVTTAMDAVDPLDGETSLREAIALANDTPGTDIVSFAPALAGGTLRLTQGEIEITDALVIDADLDDDGLPDITITGDANGDDLVLAGGITDVHATLASGAAATDGIDNDGDGLLDDADPEGDETLLDDNSRIFTMPTEGKHRLDIVGLTLTGGHSDGPGGAIYSRYTVSVTDSVIAGNGASGSGGGLYASTH